MKVRLRRASALIGACVAAVLVGCDPPGAPPPGELPAELPVGTDVGARAPGLEGTAGGGSAFELDPSVSEYTLVEFYRGAACGLCRLRLEELARYDEAYAAAGVRVVFASPDAHGLVEEARREAGTRATGVSIERSQLARWDVGGPDGAVLPASYLLDRSGVIRYRHVGRNAGDRASDIEVLAAVRQDRERRAAR